MPALYPLAIVDLLPEATTQPKITPRLVILHTNGGGSRSGGKQLRASMNRDDVTLECHFQVDLDGTVWQFMPVDVRADCNAQANGFAVSIETEDNGSATLNSTPWTDKQITSIVKVLIWLRDEYDIPMWRASAWNGSGVGAHRDFPQWSNAAHSCPGTARLAQVSLIIAGALAALPPVTTPPTQSEEDDMVDPYIITSPTFVTWVLRWPTGLLGWCTHAEGGKYQKIDPETDDSTFTALMQACSIPPVPAAQQALRN